MSDIFGSMFPNMLGEAVKHGQAEAEAEGGLAPTTEPAPASAYPQDERGGPFAERLPAETDPAPDELRGSLAAEQVHNRPIPLMGAVPFAGVITDAGQATGSSTESTVITIGDNGHNRPAVLGIYLMISYVVGATTAQPIMIYPAGRGRSSLNLGARLPVQGVPIPIFLPIRSCDIVIEAQATPSTISWLVIGSDLGPST
jgi:hypothetical protein